MKPSVTVLTPGQAKRLSAEVDEAWREMVAALCRPRRTASTVASVVLPPRECLWLAELVRL